MKRFFCSILFLYITTILYCASNDYNDKVKIIVTADFCKDIFGENLITGRQSYYSLPYAARYINSHRNSGNEKIILKNIGNGYDPMTELAGENIISRIAEYLGYSTDKIINAAGKNFGFIELSGDFKENLNIIESFKSTYETDFIIGLFDTEEDYRISRYRLDMYLYKSELKEGEFFVLETDGSGLKKKMVDYSKYEPDSDFMNFIRPYRDSIASLLDNSVYIDSIDIKDSFFGPSYISALFHRFQTECMLSELSVFAPFREAYRSSGEISLKELAILGGILNDPDAVLIQLNLTGRELKLFLESTVNKWFTARTANDHELLRYYRAENGKVYPAAYRTNYSLNGFDYSIDLNKRPGYRIRADIDEKKMYTVAVIGHKWNNYGEDILSQCSVSVFENRKRIVSVKKYFPEFIRWANEKKIHWIFR